MNNKFFLPITLLACVIIFVGWWQFIYEPARREIVSMELETRRLREVERELLELKARHENLTAFVEAKELELDAARNFLPATLAQDKFIDDHKVQLMAVDTDEVTAEEKFQAQVINVKLEADYISLLNFIREILDGERLVSLERFSAQNAEGRILSCELSFKIFATVP